MDNLLTTAQIQQFQHIPGEEQHLGYVYWDNIFERYSYRKMSEQVSRSIAYNPATKSFELSGDEDIPVDKVYCASHYGIRGWMTLKNYTGIIGDQTEIEELEGGEFVLILKEDQFYKIDIDNVFKYGLSGVVRFDVEQTLTTQKKK